MQTQEKWGVFIAMALDDLDRLATEQVGQVARLDDLLFIVPQLALSHEAMADIIDPTATKSPKMVIAAQFRTKFGQLAQVPFSYHLVSIARAPETRRQCGLRGQCGRASCRGRVWRYV